MNGNPNLREAISWARQLGCAVERVHRTGEIVFRHPLLPARMRVNARRKDSPRELVAFLKRVEIECPRAEGRQPRS